MINPINFVHRIYTRLINVTLVIIAFVAFGIVGLMLFEGLSFLESFWTVTNIITTVGASIRSYSELSNSGRIFIMFLMWIGIFLFLVAISIIAFDLMDGTYVNAFKQFKMEKKLQSLNNHVIICGFGRNGRQAARKLLNYKKQFVIIDKKEFEKYSGGEFENSLIFVGDATLDSTLKQCGIERASAMITAMPSDADNLFAVITARQLNPKLKIISRASDSHSINKLKIAGADNVIMPDKIGGEHMASLVVTPDLVEFIDQIKLEESHNKNLVEIPTNSINSEFLEKPLIDYEEYLQTPCKIIGYKDIQHQYIMNPEDAQIIRENEYIIFFGKNDQIDQLMKRLNLK